MRMILPTIQSVLATAALCVSALAALEEIPSVRKGALIFSDDFKGGTGHWFPELENGGKVEAGEGILVIDVPRGATVWLKRKIDGPVLIEYTATVVVRGGANDRLSDLNCFWMARDSRSPDALFETVRSGKFSDYNRLLTYYVGQGGNSNTTTRFRRYIGDETLRPLLPEHDLKDPAQLLTANVSQRIQLVADGQTIAYCREGKKVFEFTDSNPYTSGWFAFRTVASHLEIQDFRVYQILPAG
jgi:hypothetical protein